MTTTEAAQLVIQSGAMAKGGEVFLLDMGKPVLILDLARNMIEATGMTVKENDFPCGDIEIKITGLRVGEKLYEELLTGGNAKKTQHNRILEADEISMSEEGLNIILKKLANLTNKNDVVKIRELLINDFIGYKPSKRVVDLISSHKEKSL